MPDISDHNTYIHPFGMVMPDRQFSAEGGYRYGFNGKEQDPEVSGDGNQYDYGFRVYNPRIGKFLSVDPLTKDYPWYTPYQFAGNKPITSIDLDGKEEFNRTTYIDMFGNIYRVEITLVTCLDIQCLPIEQFQVVHETQVRVINVNGSVTSTYVGSTTGQLVPPAPGGTNPFGTSTAFTPAENALIWNQQPSTLNTTNPNDVLVTMPSYGPEPAIGTREERLPPAGSAPGTMNTLNGPFTPYSTNGVLVMNVGPAPAVEAYLPTGHTSVPPDNLNRFDIATGLPLGAPFTLQRSDITSNTDLLRVDARGTTLETASPAPGPVDLTPPVNYVVPTRQAVAATQDNPRKAFRRLPRQRAVVTQQ